MIQVVDSVSNTTTINLGTQSITVNGTVYAIAINGSGAYLGGSFTAINPYFVPGFMNIDLNSGNIANSECHWSKKLGSGDFVNSIQTIGAYLDCQAPTGQIQ